MHYFVAGRVRAEDPKDDSDPAGLIAKMGPMMAKIPIEVVNIAESLDLIKGAGGNVAVLRGPDGLLVVDSQIPARGKEVLETAKRIGGKPVATLINTHWHFDHAGGNEFFGRDGATIVATATTRKRLSTDQYTEAFKMTTRPRLPWRCRRLRPTKPTFTSATRPFTLPLCPLRTPTAT